MLILETLRRFFFVAFMVLTLSGCSERPRDKADESALKALFASIDDLPDATKEKFLDSLSQQLPTHDYSDDTRENWVKVADWYRYLDRSEKYSGVLRTLLGRDKEKNDTLRWAEDLRRLGDFFDAEQNPDSAFSYYLKAEKLFRLAHDTLNYGRVKSYKAGILYNNGNFTESLAQGIAALQLVETTNDTRLIYECQIGIALCLKELKDYDNTLKYFTLALSQLDKLETTPDYPVQNVKHSRAATFNNIGTTYERLLQYERAIDYYEKALQIARLRVDKPKLYAALLSNLAYAKMKLGREGNVLALLTESKRIRDSLGNTIAIISSQLKFGEYYLRQRDTASALASFKDAYDNARKAQVGAEMQQSLQLLTVNDANNKDFYSRRYIKVTDSLQNIERATQNKFARIAYETDQVEAENKNLSARNQRILIVAGVLLAFAMGGFLLLRLQAKNKELQLQKEQQQANETIYELMLQQQTETRAARNEERNRIAMELHDGIVNSIFTTRFNLMQLETESAEKKEQLVAELKKTEQEVRKVSHELQQNFFNEDQNLPEIIGQLVQAQQNDARTAFDFSNDKHIDWSEIPAAHKIQLYRIVQEALQNVNKYARAQQCLVMLFKTPDGVSLRIWDNGIGFNPQKSREGIGLKNMRTRAERMGASLRVQSEPGKGTTIEVMIQRGSISTADAGC